jgi:hypothetical protein
MAGVSLQQAGTDVGGFLGPIINSVLGTTTTTTTATTTT